MELGSVGGKEVPTHKLSANFDAFFGRINPSPSYVSKAARAHASIRQLIENRDGPAGDLRIRSFIQGSYGRHTAIHSINDVDVVALCGLAYRQSANKATRDQIFDLIGQAIRSDGKYAEKVVYSETSVCVKVILKDIKVEVLPALHVHDKPFEYEPFCIFEPSNDSGATQGRWVRAFARRHQELVSEKNDQTNGIFVPMIKVLKHLRSVTVDLPDTAAPPFYLESLLYAVQNTVYAGAPCEYIEHVLRALAGFGLEQARDSGLRTPCRDKQL